MANWVEMSIDSLRAAKQMHDAGRARSAASRAYFAAYAAVSSTLPKGMTFGDRRDNPPHAKLAALARHNSKKRLNSVDQQDCARMIRRLLANRVTADYDKSAVVDSAMSRESVRAASQLLDLLEVG